MSQGSVLLINQKHSIYFKQKTKSLMIIRELADLFKGTQKSCTYASLPHSKNSQGDKMLLCLENKTSMLTRLQQLLSLNRYRCATWQPLGSCAAAKCKSQHYFPAHFCKKQKSYVQFLYSCCALLKRSIMQAYLSGKGLSSTSNWNWKYKF